MNISAVDTAVTAPAQTAQSSNAPARTPPPPATATSAAAPATPAAPATAPAPQASVAALSTPAATVSVTSVPATVKPADRALYLEILKSLDGNVNAALAALAAADARAAA